MTRPSTKSRYAEHPGHPLEHVPQETLDIARAVLAESAQENDVDPEMADSIADGVVARLAEAGLLRNRPAPSVTEVAAVLREIPRDVSISADLTVGADRKPTGFITVPFDAAEHLVTHLTERLGPDIEVRRGRPSISEAITTARADFVRKSGN